MRAGLAYIFDLERSTHMSNGDIIIIKGGGSVTIEFNESTYTGKNGKYHNQHGKIASIEVTEDTGKVQTIDVPANGKCTVKINTR